MELTVNRDMMRVAIANLSAVAGPGGSMILDVRDDGTATLFAQRRRFQAWYRVLGIKGDAVRFAFDSKRLAPMLDKVSAADKKMFPEVYIEVKDDELRVCSSRSEWTIARDNAGHWVKAPKLGEGYRVAGPDFAELVNASSWAVDPESTRYALGGMKIEVDGESLRTIATNGVSMVIGSILADRFGSPAEPPIGGCTGWVTPLDTMNLAAKLAAKSDTITMRLVSDHVEFHTESGVVSSPTLEGRFPDWRGAVPDGKPACSFSLDGDDGKEFLRTAQLVAILTAEESRGVHFEIDPEKCKVDAWSEAADVGKSHIDMTINGSGEPVYGTLDPRYLLKALGVVPLGMEAKLSVHVDRGASTFVIENLVAKVILSSMTSEVKPRYLAKPSVKSVAAVEVQVEDEPADVKLEAVEAM